MSSKFKVQSSKFLCQLNKGQTGFTLLELIITLFVLSILVMGTIPLTQNAARRQKEMRLRETLRVMRNAIDEFHRDTIGACPQGAITTTNRVPTQGRLPGGFGQNTAADPRSRVVIDDCKIFDTENLDRYPPSLELLAEGVSVKPRGLNVTQNGAFSDKNATDLNEETEHKKVYLREIPVDPMTGEKDWKLRSVYQDGDAESWDEINVFDVRSSSDDEALNGEKYSDW